jgi:hypothetical protein
MNAQYIPPTYNFNIAKDLYNDWLKTNDADYKASLSTVINVKLSTMTQMVNLTNQNLLNQISSIRPY